MLGIYVRLSQVDEGSNSIDNQIREGEDFAKKNNLKFKVYNEGQGLSGGLGEESRPELNNLLEDVRSGLIDSVWVRDQKRIERSTKLYFKVVDLFKLHNTKFYINDKFQDVHDPTVMLQGTMTSVWASYQREQQGYMTKRAIRDNFKEGKTHGVPPFGYTSDKRILVIKEEEAEIVRQIFQWSLDGLGTEKIAEKLNNMRVPTRYNQKEGTYRVNKKSIKAYVKEKKDAQWRGGTIRAILKNTIYKGERRHKDGFFPAPAILDAWYWQKVNDNFKNNSNTRGKKVEHSYLLKGLLTCGYCGRNYYGKTRVPKLNKDGKLLKPKDNYYTCSSKRRGEDNCGNRSINIDALDTLIWSKLISDGRLQQMILDHFENSDLATKRKELNTQIDVLTAQQESIAFKRKKTLMALGELENVSLSETQELINEYQKETDLVSSKLSALVLQLEELEKGNKDKQSYIDELSHLKDLSIDEKRGLLKKYIKDIEIKFVLNKVFNVKIEFNVYGMNTVEYIIPSYLKHAFRVFGGAEFILTQEWEKVDPRLEIIFLDDSEEGRVELDPRTKEMHVTNVKTGLTETFKASKKKK